MSLLIGVRTLTNEPMLVMLLLSFALLTALMIPLYFYVRKPKAGTTEWISRLDPVHFGPLPRYALRGPDVIWAILTGICAGFLCMLSLMFAYRMPQQENALQVIRAAFPLLVRVAAPAALFGIGVFLLLRIMFNRTFCAMSLGVLAGLLVHGETKACALLVFSLLFLYLWASAPYDAPMFPNAIWLVLSGGCYALALLPCVAMIWLLPFYGIVYIAVQAARFRNGEPEGRGRKLLISLLLIFLAFVAGVFALLAAFAFIEGWLSYSGFGILFTREFYSYMLIYIKATVKMLLTNSGLRQHVVVGDAFGLILGGIALIPLLHGIFRLRDSRCLLLVCLLVFSAIGYLVSGYYYVLVPMLLITDWTWSTFRKRGHPAYPVLFAGVTGLFYFLHIILL